MIDLLQLQKDGIRLPMAAGDFRLHIFKDEQNKEHLALVHGEISGKENVLTRLHSECLTGDLFGSKRCDCGYQLKSALEMIAEKGAGVLLYMRQEGRGIGLVEKLKAYHLQDQGYDTVEANQMLGHRADERDYGFAAKMLADLGVQSIKLITNNPEKISALTKFGVRVDRVVLGLGVSQENLPYLKTKSKKMNHLFDL